MISKIQEKLPRNASKDSVIQFEDLPFCEIELDLGTVSDASDEKPKSISLSFEVGDFPRLPPYSSLSLYDSESPLDDFLGSVSNTTEPKERIVSDIMLVCHINKNERRNDEIFHDTHSIHPIVSLGDGTDLEQRPHDRSALTEQTMKQMQENDHRQQSMIHDFRLNLPSDSFAMKAIKLPAPRPLRNRSQRKETIGGGEKGKGVQSLTRPFEKLKKLMERTASSRCLLLRQKGRGNTSSALLMRSLSAMAFETIVSSTKITSNVSAVSFGNNNSVPDTSTTTSSGLTKNTEGFENNTEHRMSPTSLFPPLTRNDSMDSLPSCGSLASSSSEVGVSGPIQRSTKFNKFSGLEYKDDHWLHYLSQGSVSSPAIGVNSPIYINREFNHIQGPKKGLSSHDLSRYSSKSRGSRSCRGGGKFQLRGKNHNSKNSCGNIRQKTKLKLKRELMRITKIGYRTTKIGDEGRSGSSLHIPYFQTPLPIHEIR